MGMTPSGIAAVGDLAWGTHFCQFYQTRDDLAGSLVPFFRAGLNNHEKCLWVTADPFGTEDARAALRAALPDLAAYEERGQIEIVDHLEWYTRQGRLAPEEVVRAWVGRARKALDEGYEGLRLTGNTFWLEPCDWREFVEYEATVNAGFMRERVVALCSYCLDRCRPADVLDVVRNHSFALTRRGGDWEVIEDASLRLARAELERLNAELELRVAARTADLEGALADKDALLREVHHRVRNNLQVVTSLVRLKLRQEQGRELRDGLAEVLGRIESVALVHDTLHAAGRPARVPFGAYLRRLAEGLAGLHGGAASVALAVESTGEEELDLEMAATLGLVANELVMNAFRHAFPAGRGGRVDVLFTGGADRIELAVRDDGVGLRQQGTGTGLRLAQSFASQLGGELTVATGEHGGTTAAVTVPRRSPSPGAR